VGLAPAAALPPAARRPLPASFADPQCLLLDVTGSARRFGGETRLLEQLFEHFDRQGFVLQAALADTLGAAWALAHFGFDPPELCRHWTGPQVAESSSLVVPVGQTAPALAPLPIEALRLAPETIDGLHELGLVQIRQLEPIERSGIAARFGPELLRRWDQALGQAAETIVTYRPPAEFEADWSFEFPTESLATLEAALAELLGKLITQLLPRNDGIQQLAYRLRGENGSDVSFRVGLFRASLEARHLLELVQLRLERLRLSEPIAGVHLAVLATSRLEVQQQELFAHENRRGDPRPLALLVDRLSSRLGPDCVLRARLWPEAQPEYAYRYEACLESQAKRSRPRAVRERRHDLQPLERPLRLSGPQPIEVISIVPDGPPLSFRWERREHRIAHSWGPERIETGWWRDGSARRDYYCVETVTGQRLWIFRRLRDGRWFFHGCFE
jgi:protein ImuB